MTDGATYEHIKREPNGLSASDLVSSRAPLVFDLDNISKVHAGHAQFSAFPPLGAHSQLRLFIHFFCVRGDLKVVSRQKIDC